MTLKWFYGWYILNYSTKYKINPKRTTNSIRAVLTPFDWGGRWNSEEPSESTMEFELRLCQEHFLVDSHIDENQGIKFLMNYYFIFCSMTSDFLLDFQNTITCRLRFWKKLFAYGMNISISSVLRMIFKMYLRLYVQVCEFLRFSHKGLTCMWSFA